ncbi:MAG: alanine--tRNA ligase [Candidatus Liptonbacteria bacterium]|nr:alanine--tRNA ligase [Candidatus Liptonbacteria bacterium]
MGSEDIRKKFLEFFKSRGHAIVSSSSLIPDDPSVLLTTAGMQQFKPYFIGKADPIKDFGSKNTASIQKSFRTSDIDMVGDESHLTFFEMLGNFSFGGYFKKEAIEYAHEFIVKEMGLKIEYVSVFKGDSEVPADIESEKIWKSLGVSDIRKFGRKDNFWGPTGSEGPCGPTTEIYVKNITGKSIEVWNIVFNEYYCRQSQHPTSNIPARLRMDKVQAGGQRPTLEKLKTPGVDTGMGLERLAMVVQKVPTIFETDLFSPIIDVFPKKMPDRTKRIIADHIRGSSFLISDGVQLSNRGVGAVLKRLVRHAVVETLLGIKDVTQAQQIISSIVQRIIEIYGSTYLNLKKEEVLRIYVGEIEKTEIGMSKWFKEFDRQLSNILNRPNLKSDWGEQAVASGQIDYLASTLYLTFGIPVRVIKELLAKRGITVDDRKLQDTFDREFTKHQEISRAGQEKKFGGHGLLLNTGELKAKDEEELKKVTRLHTATHMLQQALRDVLGQEVKQMGSDITVERTRFDFTFSRKLTREEIEKIEAMVNAKIKEDLPMQKQVLPKAEAEKTGALYFFKEKYPDPVNVYFIGKTLETAWSKEFCGGPHVGHTGEIGSFKIIKEEAIGAGVRRIRGIVRP